MSQQAVTLTPSYLGGMFTNKDNCSQFILVIAEHSAPIYSIVLCSNIVTVRQG